MRSGRLPDNLKRTQQTLEAVSKQNIKHSNLTSKLKKWESSDVFSLQGKARLGSPLGI